MDNLGDMYALAADRGGWNALAPVLKQALSEGCGVRVFLVGTTAQQFRSGSLKIDDRVPTETDINILRRFFASSRLVTILGASQSAEGTMAPSRAAIASPAPLLSIQDYYGSAIPLLKALGREKNLDTLCVTDEIARDHLIKQGFSGQHIVVTGGPHFDLIKEKKDTWIQDRQRLRTDHGISENEKIFLVVGQPGGTAEILGLLDQAIKTSALLKDAARVIVRMHSRATTKNQQAVQRFLQNPSALKAIDIPSTRIVSSDDLLPAADFVLSGYSTTNHIGILYQMPGVIYVGTPKLTEDLKRDTGHSIPLEVAYGAAWYVQTPAELIEALREIQKGQESSKLQQILHKQTTIAAHNDGRATERVWKEISKL